VINGRQERLMLSKRWLLAHCLEFLKKDSTKFGNSYLLKKLILTNSFAKSASVNTDIKKVFKKKQSHETFKSGQVTFFKNRCQNYQC
jgi:hypothetical protein